MWLQLLTLAIWILDDNLGQEQGWNDSALLMTPAAKYLFACCYDLEAATALPDTTGNSLQNQWCTGWWVSWSGCSPFHKCCWIYYFILETCFCIICTYIYGIVDYPFSCSQRSLSGCSLPIIPWCSSCRYSAEVLAFIGLCNLYHPSRCMAIATQWWQRSFLRKNWQSQERFPIFRHWTWWGSASPLFTK